MEKMDGKTMDIVAENVGKLKELFPEAFTEGKVDFEAFKEVLGTFVDDRDERYSFTWNGKSKARMIAQTPSTGTLRPCKEESVDWDSTQNIFIEGDNLEVLKLLQKSYHKKVKMIYIDPPYNTGQDFVYKDNFKDNIKNYKEITGQVDGEGRYLSNNPETSGRYHTDWLNMMYPRLKLARNLLKDDGVIFISIDDGEVANLRNICDEIFGEENFIANLIWQKKYTRANDAKWFSDNHDHLLCYGKNKLGMTLNMLPRNDEQLAAYSNPDSHHKGIWKATPLHAKSGTNTSPYTFNNGITWAPPKGTFRRFNDESMRQMDVGNEIWFGNDGSQTPSRKSFLCDVKDGVTPVTLWPYEEVGHNHEANNELKALELGGLFNNPKPTRLLKRALILSCDKKDLILDFFAGSGTTADAVLQLNAEDGGDRHYVVVQLPETCDEKSEAFKSGYKTIAEISKERIRRAAAKIKEELATTEHTENTEKENSLFGEADQETFRDFRAFRGSNIPDLGFKVFKLDSTNIKPWEADFDLTEQDLLDYVENIKTDRREEDVLYEILLKYGLDLTLPIDEWIMDNGKLIMKEKSNSQLSTVNSQLSTVNSQLSTVNSQLVYSIGRGALIICLSDDISLEVVQGIAKLKDKLNPEIMRVVFKDSGFKDDVVKTNAVQILKQAGIVDVRSL